uniref:C-type cytochrome n=1 Tax=Geobacter metallireducens TaxID=28232 RepID=A0A831TYA9_GEOME
MAAGFALMAAALGLAACTAGSGQSGETLFATHCAGCHPNGGNTVNPARTLSRAHREAGGIRTAADVAAFIRNPGPGMPAFSEGMIPDGDAAKIGEYVVTTFN